MGRTAPLAAAVGVLVAWPAAPGPAAAQDATGVRVQANVVYGQGRVAAPSARDVPLLLDLYQPARRRAARRPVAVLIHGGGFRIGTRKQPDLVRIAEGLVGRGFVVASIDYRLSPRSPVPSRRVRPLLAEAPGAPVYRAMAAAVDDSLTAVSWLRRNAGRLRLDVARLGLIGGSAGAITADHVAYALDDAGVRGPRVRFVGDLWGGIFIPADQRAAAAQLERGEAQLFAVHGDADATVPVTFDDALVARARAVGVRTEYQRIPGGGHGFAGTGFFTRRVTGGRTPFRRLLAFATRAVR
jgi:acetyl esterase/lipase